MGVRHGYGKIAGTDALVFAYDTGDTRNSYKGEPTENLNSFTLSDSGTDGSGQGSVGTRTLLSDNHVRIVDVNSNTRQTHLIQGLTGGTIYTISVEFKKLSGTPTFRFQIQDHSGGTYLRTIKFTNTAETGIVDKDGWQTASWTFTLGADANAVRIWYQDGADYTTYTHSFELRNPQLEAKSHATPFAGVGGTRSATQGLLDLVGNYTFDLSNVSFTSDAQIDFDGTDDFITLANTDLRPGFTLETVCYPESSTFAVWGQGPTVANRGLHIIATGGPRGFVYGMYANDRDYGNYIPTLNQWYHWVFTYDGTSFAKEFFANGQKQTPTASVQAEWIEGSSALRLGTNYGSGTAYSKANGKIAVAKYYNRPLSDAEIINNYNNYKGRFNI